MAKEDKNLLLELLLTWLLCLSLILLFSQISPVYKLVLLPLLSSGFFLGWFIRDRQIRLTGIFTDIGGLAVLGWALFAILKSSFIFRHIVVIWLQAAFLLLVILSFSAAKPKVLNLIQLLSVPLFMACTLFLKIYAETFFLLAAAYIICWFVILRVKFCCLIDPGIRINFKRDSFLSAGLAVVSALTAWALFSALPLKGLSSSSPLLGNLGEMDWDTLEKEYYDLQNKVQDRITKLIPEATLSRERYDIFEMLQTLIKEWPYAIEVDKAQQGLVSYLRTPGLGLEKGDIDGLVIMMDSYLDKKALVNQKRSRQDLMEKLKIPLLIKEKISILGRLNALQNSSSYKQGAASAAQLQKAIDGSGLSDEIKQDLRSFARRFKQWWAFELYRKKINALNTILDSMPGQKRQYFTAMLADIAKMEQPSDSRKINEEIEYFKSQNPEQEGDALSGIEEVLNLKSEILLTGRLGELRDKIEDLDLPVYKINELKAALDNIEATQDYQKFSEEYAQLQQRLQESQVAEPAQVKELLEAKQEDLARQDEERVKEILKESAAAPPAPSEPLGRAAGFKDYLYGISAKAGAWAGRAVSILALITVMVFFILYFVTERKKKELVSLLAKPGEFIIRLYENIREVLAIFGLRYEQCVTPQSFAHLIDNSYCPKDNLFFKLTVKFEEAKYSRHSLVSGDAAIAVDYYNNFLSLLLHSHSKPYVFFKYLATLFKRKPLFIAKR